MSLAKQAIEKAETDAKASGIPQTVWRCGDQFANADERKLSSEVFPNADGPIRPVLTVDPDGRQYY